MKNVRLKMLLVLVSLFVVGGVLLAQDYAGRVREMDARINQGVRSGQLTRPEEQRLRQQLFRIRDQAARMKADGRLTPAERTRLDRELDALRQNIYREKHDSQKRTR